MYGPELGRLILTVVKSYDFITVNDLVDQIATDKQKADKHALRSLKIRVRRSLKNFQELGLVRIERCQHPSKNNTYWKICSV